MEKIEFAHGGAEFDWLYPNGIPSQITIEIAGKVYDSGMIMYPSGHARNTTTDL